MHVPHSAGEPVPAAVAGLVAIAAEGSFPNDPDHLAEDDHLRSN
jgi:hypothetical protein